MELFVFSRRDKKLGAYDVPFFEREDVEHVKVKTIRALKFVKPEEVARAADFALYFVGMFDDVSGKFSLLPEAEKIFDFEDYLPRKADLENGKEAA